MTSLSKISSYTDKEWKICVDSGSWALPCPSELYLVQIASCTEYYIPPRSTWLEDPLEPIVPPQPEVGQRLQNASTLESVLEGLEPGRGPIPAGDGRFLSGGWWPTPQTPVLELWLKFHRV